MQVEKNKGKVDGIYLKVFTNYVFTSRHYVNTGVSDYAHVNYINRNRSLNIQSSSINTHTTFQIQHTIHWPNACIIIPLVNLRDDHITLMGK